MPTARPTDTSDPRQPTELDPAPLPARDAYRLWAPHYEAETAVSALDELAAGELTPALGGRTLLDAGCGTGRRLPAPSPSGPHRVMGIDLVREMLEVGRRLRGHAPRLSAADVRALPFPACSFDVVWCRLVLGHIRELDLAYHEFFRVTLPEGSLIVTDFHAAAAAAGHARTFRDDDGVLRGVETQLHTMGDHWQAARNAGFRLATWRDWCVGPEVERFYQEASATERYEEQRGIPLLLALRFTK